MDQRLPDSDGAPDSSGATVTGGASSLGRRLLRRWIGVWPAMELRNKVLAARVLPRMGRFEDAEVARLTADQGGDLPSARVACIVPTYKRPHGVIAAINSILAQDFQDFVIVVVDDGAGLPELPDDPRILAVSLSRNVAIAGLVRNVGVRLSRSEFIAFLDDDNTWTPDHLQVALGGLELGADIVYTAVRRWLPNGKAFDVLSQPFDRRRFANETSWVDINSVVLRRATYRRFSRMPRKPGMFPREDWEFFWRSSRGARVDHIPAPTVDYLMNPKSFWTEWYDEPDEFFEGGPVASA